MEKFKQKIENLEDSNDKKSKEVESLNKKLKDNEENVSTILQQKVTIETLNKEIKILNELKGQQE